MKKLLTIIILAAGMAHGQTYNVAITNSLLGPVNLGFTNTQVNVSQAVITGAVVTVQNAVVTGAVFNANFTNDINNTINVSNDITQSVSVTNIIGATTVVNSNTFVTVLTNEVNVAGVTVSNNFAPTNIVTVSNSTVYSGTFTQTIVSNTYPNYQNVNVFTPTVGSTNVTGTWTISLTTNDAVETYTQTGNITSVVFSVTSTNDVALGEVLFRATTNSLTWPTNKLTWAAGSAPTLTTGQWSIILFHAWRDDVHGVYVGDSP